ncbi:signal peptidase I [Streptomyces sp. B8F3]|uniref:signal peptidase I n=1 Tax=Streptomyces sp. B8F3 TaxID=3153573 RepID=UPI00325C8FEA
MSSSGAGRRGNVLSGLAVAVGCVLFLGGFAWGAAVYVPYTVPTSSMAPTVDSGDRVLAERISGDEVRRGDVVVFEDAAWGDLPMVKRVVAVGGDTVRCCDGQWRLTVGGAPVAEPYVTESERAAQEGFPATTVPEGMIFLLGDRRGDSVDSRHHLAESGGGAIPRDAVKGRVDATAWPPGRVGTLERPDGFAALPGGISGPGPLGPLLLAVVAGAALILGGAAYGPVSGYARARRARATHNGVTHRRKGNVP